MARLLTPSSKMVCGMFIIIFTWVTQLNFVSKNMGFQEKLRILSPFKVTNEHKMPLQRDILKMKLFQSTSRMEKIQLPLIRMKAQDESTLIKFLASNLYLKKRAPSPPPTHLPLMMALPPFSSRSMQNQNR